MSRVNWTAVVIVGMLAVLAVMFGGGLLFTHGYSSWGYGPWGMMGPWMMGGMFFMWLIPVGLVLLTVLGVSWVVRPGGGAVNPGTANHTCPSCGRGVQADWKSCPYCGTGLPK